MPVEMVCGPSLVDFRVTNGYPVMFCLVDMVAMDNQSIQRIEIIKQFEKIQKF